MQITLESTSKVVEIMINGVLVPARIWEGATAAGIRCHAYITRIAADETAQHDEFKRDLLEVRRPAPAVASLPGAIVL